jgi:hypothetical protein
MTVADVLQKLKKQTVGKQKKFWFTCALIHDAKSDPRHVWR